MIQMSLLEIKNMSMNYHSIKGETKALDNVNFNVDISTNDNRNKLLNAINNKKDYSKLKEEEKTFIEVLKFIDTLLGTSFTKSEDDMYKLYLSSTLMKNDDFIKDTFLAATRSLLINNIYTEFRNSKLGRNQIIKFSESTNRCLKNSVCHIFSFVLGIFYFFKGENKFVC